VYTPYKDGKILGGVWGTPTLKHFVQDTSDDGFSVTRHLALAGMLNGTECMGLRTGPAVTAAMRKMQGLESTFWWVSLFFLLLLLLLLLLPSTIVTTAHISLARHMHVNLPIRTGKLNIVFVKERLLTLTRLCHAAIHPP